VNMAEQKPPANRVDVLTIGRIGVDLYPLQDGVGLEDVETFGKYLGGSATNVAIAAARHGLNSGVDDRFVGVADRLHTPVTFCEIFPPDHFPLYFYRDPIAPDLTLTAEDLDTSAIAQARIYWATVTGLSRDPSRSAHHVAWNARGRAPLTILDLDYRPMFWPSGEEASAEVGRALEKVTVAVGNREECHIAVGETDPQRAADALLERGVELAVVKQGPRGVLGKTRAEFVEVAPYPVTVVNGLGAGDGFGGALCYGLLQGWPLARTLQFANIAGAIVSSRRECSTAMPTTAEIENIAKDLTRVDA
jgi:5-dehydro-2-deoxygluconokinase